MQTSSADATRLVTELTRLARHAGEAEQTKTKEAHKPTQKKSVQLFANILVSFVVLACFLLMIVVASCCMQELLLCPQICYLPIWHTPQATKS